MITQSTVLDKIEITRDNFIQIRFALLLVQNGVEIAPPQWHRTAFFPGSDIDAQIAAVNAHLNLMGKPQVDPADTQKIKDHAGITWTPAAIQAYKAAKAAQDAAKAPKI